MKIFWKAFAAGTVAGIALIFTSGYGFIFKALGMNLEPGPITPSIDDAEKFPFHTVSAGMPKPWEKDTRYNQTVLPSKILENLKESKAASLLVIKNNRLLHEQYWEGHNEDSLFNSFSMAKGFLSLLTGAAIKEGHIRCADQSFSDFYPQYAEDQFGKNLRLKHLMTMQAALDWEEEYHHPFAPNSKQYFTEDLGALVFGCKLKEEPGIRYEYQSAAPQLLGFALRKAVGENLAQYLSEKFWVPLGMECSAKWSTDSKGMEKAFCCLHATARDFAKIGQLLLNKGTFGDKELLSAKYVEEITTPTAANSAFGYTIWVNNEARLKHLFFYGFLGQFIIVVPEEQMVVVKTGHFNGLPVDEKLRPLQVGFLVDELSRIF